MVTDATGREIEVYAGEVDGEPVAVLAVRPRGDWTVRPVVELWLCPDQLHELDVQGRAAIREAAES